MSRIPGLVGTSTVVGDHAGSFFFFLAYCTHCDFPLPSILVSVRIKQTLSGLYVLVCLGCKTTGTKEKMVGIYTF